MKLLLIEDDEELGEATVAGLRLGGHSVEWVQDGEEGLYRALEWEWDIIILDRMLPGLEGTKLLQKLKAKKQTPVLMLTALNEVDHRLEGFDAGADDYLGKPFELRELLARVRALGRRAYPSAQSEQVQLGELTVDFEMGRIVRGGQKIELTLAELRTLEHLVMRRGRVVSRRQLEDLLADGSRDVQPNAVEVHIHRLRSKVGPDVIKTRRGQGYLIEGEGSE